MTANTRIYEDSNAPDHHASDFGTEELSREMQVRQTSSIEDGRLGKDVLGFPVLTFTSQRQANRVAQFRKTEQATPRFVDPRLLPGLGIKEMPEHLSDQAMMGQLDKLRDQIHPRASFIHSLCSADETSSKHMLDQLRKGIYDAALSCGDGLLGPRVTTSKDYPWKSNMRNSEE